MDPAASTGGSFLQAGAALVAVLSLLILCLKLMQRFQSRQGGDDRVKMLSMHRLGPKRDLQELRVGDEVYTLYRQEGAMVVLKTQDHEVWELTRAQDVKPVGPAASAANLGRRLMALAASAGGQVQKQHTP